MKKLLCLLIALFLFAGCSGETATEESKTKEETTTTTTEPVVVNDVYYGELYSRAEMTIQNMEGDPYTYDVNISWGSSALEHTNWSFTVNTLEGTATYDNCYMMDIVFEESDAQEAVDGYIEKDTTVYENMTGTLKFDNANNKVTWHSDYADDTAHDEDIVFVLYDHVAEEPVEKDYYGEIATRASMKIVTVGDVYHVTIDWADSAFESVEWALQLDSNEGTVSYDYCICDDVVYEESNDPKAVDGILTTYTEIYNNGTGTFTFDNVNNKVTWHSDMECDNAYDEDVVFVLNAQ